MFSTLRPHQLGETLDQPLTDRCRGLRSHISGGDAGAAGGHHQTRDLALLPEGRFDRALLVRDDDVANYREAIRLQQFHHDWSGEVDPCSQKTGVAHSNDSGTKHKPIVRVSSSTCGRARSPLSEARRAAKIGNNERIERYVKVQERGLVVPPEPRLFAAPANAHD